jgi:hypothetical protein
MPYREVRIGQEVFVTRVPPGAIAEWINIRERNKLIGYPDRPPDVDTPLLRMWISHPNEVNAFTISPETLEKAEEIYPIYSIVGAGPMDTEIKLLVSYASKENKYVFRHLLRSEDGTSLGDESFAFPEEMGTLALEADLRAFSEFPVLAGSEYYISTYEDFEFAQEETTRAQEELKEYYKDEDRLVN